MPQTREAIDGLKDSWRRDPIWDIEETEGFEEHREELEAFRREMEAFWERRWQETLTAKAVEIGCPGNLTLAAYIMRLERRVDELERAAV